jgi:hypothetical protein
MSKGVVGGGRNCVYPRGKRLGKLRMLEVSTAALSLVSAMRRYCEYVMVVALSYYSSCWR